MARNKPEPIEAFKDNISDAEALVRYSRAFANQRTRRMRKELRDRIGDALQVPAKDRDDLDCIESDDLFVVLKPQGNLQRDDFDDHRPLLRQAIVAGCTALETYVADKAMTLAGPALRADEVPASLLNVPMTVGQWVDIEAYYDRRGWGIRAIVEEYVREMSSTAPSQIGRVLSIIGVTGWAKKVDSARSVPRGDTEKLLDGLTTRRNNIAHTGDRRGGGRAQLELDDTEGYINDIKSVAQGIEKALANHSV